MKGFSSLTQLSLSFTFQAMKRKATRHLHYSTNPALQSRTTNAQSAFGVSIIRLEVLLLAWLLELATISSMITLGSTIIQSMFPQVYLHLYH